MIEGLISIRLAKKECRVTIRIDLPTPQKIDLNIPP